MPRKGWKCLPSPWLVMFKGSDSILIAQIPAPGPGRQWGEGPASLNTVAWAKVKPSRSGQTHKEEQRWERTEGPGEATKCGCKSEVPALRGLPDSWFLELRSFRNQAAFPWLLFHVLHLLMVGPVWPHPPASSPPRPLRLLIRPGIVQGFQAGLSQGRHLKGRCPLCLGSPKCESLSPSLGPPPRLPGSCWDKNHCAALRLPHPS